MGLGVLADVGAAAAGVVGVNDAALCTLQVRRWDKEPWRSIPPACRIAVALHRFVELQDEYPAVRIIQDGRVLFETLRSAPTGDHKCPQTS